MHALDSYGHLISVEFKSKVFDQSFHLFIGNLFCIDCDMQLICSKVCIYLTSSNEIDIKNEVLSHLLKDFIDNEIHLKKLSIDEIQTTVAKKFNVTITQILSSERTQSLVTPRQLSMYIARKFTTKSLPEIAKAFEKTHATILHGVRNIEKRLDVESDLKAMLAEILSEFGYSISDKDNIN